MIRTIPFAMALAACVWTTNAQAQTPVQAAGTPLYQGTITPELVDVRIDAHTTREALAMMQKDLMPMGIHMRYEGIQWENGLLTSIHVGVKMGDQPGIVEHFTGITEETVIRIHAAGAGDARKLCLGTDCPQP